MLPVPTRSLDTYSQSCEAHEQEHAQCSELFYRETIQSSIASDPSHSMEEKKHMMDILQRIKDGEEDDHAVLEMLSRQAGAGGDGELGGKLGEGSGRTWEVDEDEEELARQLEGVDIGMSPLLGDLTWSYAAQ